MESSGRTDRLESATGKLVKYTYVKHFYGAEAILKVVCDKCDFEAEILWSDEISSSDMDELA